MGVDDGVQHEMAGTEDGLERPVVEASDFPQGFNVMLVATAVEHGQQGEAPRYLFRGPARGPLASGPGMTVSPCRRDDLGG
ncbi:hypothetical protein, partial [Streptomyces sp. NPDC087538]|uniref:hypothetical protein n=1 Tax=Streptomyces sp. NPDC087538 TaxID=3365797 RepID=UPI003809105F